MDILCYSTQASQSDSDLCSAGLILKGKTRHTRQPVHMILLVDTSGSMESDSKLASVQKSINLLTSLLTSDDRISLITFADSASIVLSKVIPSPEQRQALLYRVESLKADGSTNMSAGILLGHGLVESSDSGRKQGIILLTDGHANMGVMRPEKIDELLQHLLTTTPGVSFTTVGYGSDHNTNLLTQMAKTGGGAYNVVNTLEDVATVFGDILGGLVSVSVQCVSVELPSGAQAMTSFKNANGSISIGDLYADAEIVVLCKTAASFGPIKVKGIDMSTLTPIEELISPTPFTNSETLPLSLCIAEYREQTSTLLKLVGTEKNSTLLPKIQKLIDDLKADQRVSTHPLYNLLLEDLQKAKTLLEQPSRITHHETVEMAQHSAYFGMTRGLRTMTSSVAPGRRAGAAAHLAAPIGITSPFANRHQTQYADAMRLMSQQSPSEEDPDHTSPH
jgi:uncharacterized protein YegL